MQVQGKQFNCTQDSPFFLRKIEFGVVQTERTFPYLLEPHHRDSNIRRGLSSLGCFDCTTLSQCRGNKVCRVLMH